MQPYERFDAWKESHKLVLAVYRVTKRFPGHELYGLTSQSRRAAFSVAANLVEGSAKRGGREFRWYLDISLASLAELTYALRLARDLEYLSEQEWIDLDAQRNRAGGLVWGLYASVGGIRGKRTHTRQD